MILSWLLLTSLSWHGALSLPTDQLPVVDLGYSKYRATAINETGAYYNFSNIRYAAPPTGQLRFAAPAPPVSNSEVQDGSTGHRCLQSVPQWWAQESIDLGDLIQYFPRATAALSTDEDCLFLDVISPTQIFDKSKSKKRKLAPVLVNIHGGGFIVGDKNGVYNPQGLLHESKNGIVFVSMNYRLGAFGFLPPLSKSPSDSASPNAGLLDQRFALRWIQKNIHLFGGDPKQVTILGQSAGGGSVEFHTVAYGGSKPSENTLFTRVVPESPAPTIIDPVIQQQAQEGLLAATGAKSLSDLRKLPASELQAAIGKVQGPIPYNRVLWGPTIDNDLIPDLPKRLYTSDRFIKGLDVLASHTTNEGRLFANQSAKTDEDYDYWVSQSFLATTPAIRDYIREKLYPPVYDGSQPYKTPLERLELTLLEYLVGCNAVDIENAYSKARGGGQGRSKVFGWLFDVYPALHAQDLYFAYYNGNGNTASPTLATQLQRAIVAFVLTGDPNGRIGGGQDQRQRPRFPPFGPSNGKVLKLGAGGFTPVQEPQKNKRCEWWSKALYFPRVGGGLNTQGGENGDDVVLER